ncbi:MAG: 3-methyl-2-oxobutanoate hydroxymethyltransferase [Chloroflexota bacterium]|nr:3-methyl-2-oxobutanoate hydroxymethyltransferase [Chloroflexota bacterium]
MSVPTPGGQAPVQGRAKLTVPEIQRRKHGPKLVMVTAFDYFHAKFAEEAGIDLLLVGDSLGMTFQGENSTVPVRLEHIIYHCQAVVRGAPHTHIVADLPFLTYQRDNAQALTSAGRLVQEGGADAVKLEGGRQVADRIRTIVEAGIAVVAHIGLTPQAVGRLGGFRVQGRELESARAILADAEAVAAAGAYAVVVEAVPANLAALITERVAVPTIGIGAGAACDGQVLVTADLLGIEDRIAPRFAKRYAELGNAIRSAYAAYAEDVRDASFPDAAHSYTMSPEIAAELAGDGRA